MATYEKVSRMGQPGRVRVIEHADVRKVWELFPNVVDAHYADARALGFTLGSQPVVLITLKGSKRKVAKDIERVFAAGYGYYCQPKPVMCLRTGKPMRGVWSYAVKGRWQSMKGGR